MSVSRHGRIKETVTVSRRIYWFTVNQGDYTDCIITTFNRISRYIVKGVRITKHIEITT
jgi:hypothetical protein